MFAVGLKSEEHRTPGAHAHELSRGAQVTRTIVVWSAAVVTAIIFCWPVFLEIENVGLGDWDQHFFYHAVARQAVVEFQQVPGWNPYYFGGTVCLANPQSRVFSPGFVLVCLLGEVQGLKVDLVLHLAVGIAGLCFLAFRLGLSYAAVVVTAAVGALNGAYFLNMSVGHTWYMAVCYGPWIWLCWMRARRGEWHAAVLTGALLAITWFDGGAYVVVIFGTLLAVQVLAESDWRHWRRELAAATLTAAVAASLGAIKLLPTAHFMSMFPRPTDTRAGYSFFGLSYSLFHPHQSFANEGRLYQTSRDFWHGFNFGLDENGMYVGGLAGALFVAGFLTRPARGLWIPIIVLAWLMWGDRAPVSLWEWVHTIVPFHWMRVAMRFRIAWILPVAVLCGFGVEWLRSRTSSTRWNWVIWVIAGLVVTDLYRENGRVLAGAFPVAPPPNRPSSEFVQVAAAPGYSASPNAHPYTPRICWSSHYPLFLSNTGAISGYEVIPIPKRAVPIDEPERYQGEVYMANGAGEARFIRWTPNLWEIQTSTTEPGRVVINQNFYPGWYRRTAGQPVEPFNGLLSVQVPAGTHRLVIAYDPPGLTIGLVITIVALPVSLAGAIGYWWRQRHCPLPYRLVQAVRQEGHS